MLNLIRKFLRPTLREQLEAGVREALRRYADRRTAPDLRVYVSTDLIPERMEPDLWSRDEADHLRRFAVQWAEDNNIARAGLRIEVVLLDTKQEFAFVKPLGLDEPNGNRRTARPLSKSNASDTRGARDRAALLEIVDSPAVALQGPLRVDGELVIGRKSEDGVRGMDDRYMSARHARFKVESGRLWVTDLDSKNRTFINDIPLPAHEATAVEVGDTIRIGTTTLRLTRVEG
ncbi:MAG TPA: FHA domain-containing protein [Longimicrobiaceae bacterium]|nr:FHA domain-containing protein [Longimicrobiaceae bacterium]